jgi:hypothetical protein
MPPINKPTESSIGSYLTITNGDGKVWVLPSNNLKTALNLYQPSSIKGKMLKSYLPVLNIIPIIGGLVRKYLHINIGQYSINSVLDNFIREVFTGHENKGIEELNYSFFLGTPSVHQKTTIQISVGNKILGYCKFSNSQLIKNIFVHEKNILNYLQDKGVNNIPRCLYCGDIENGSNTTILVQTTIKTGSYVVKNNITLEHIKFLKNLAERTEQVCSYRESDYFQMLEQFKRSLFMLKNAGFEVTGIKKAIVLVEQSLNKVNVFSVYHCDFTPWNMFFENGILFVFDFEYAKLKYPKMIDIFHYFTQIAIFIKEWSFNQIYEEFEKTFINGKFKNLFSNPHMSYLYYLLDIVALYTLRDEGDISNDVRRNMEIWLQLTEKLCNKIIT